MTPQLFNNSQESEVSEMKADWRKQYFSPWLRWREIHIPCKQQQIINDESTRLKPWVHLVKDFFPLEEKTETGLAIEWQKWEGTAKMSVELRITINKKRLLRDKMKAILTPRERWKCGSNNSVPHSSHLAALHCLCYFKQKPKSIGKELWATMHVSHDEQQDARNRKTADRFGW